MLPARGLPSPRTHWRKRRRVRRGVSGRSFSFNLRLPGQYFDQETGLTYNGVRDYDPATARYVEADPIGLEGGSMSTYAYVGGDPISSIDPSGLTPHAPGRAPTYTSPGAFPVYPSDPQMSHAATALDNALGDFANRVGIAFERMCNTAIDDCFTRFDKEVVRCERWRGKGPPDDPDRWYRACKSRAADRRNLCYRNKGPDPDEPPEWGRKDITG